MRLQYRQRVFYVAVFCGATLMAKESLKEEFPDAPVSLKRGNPIVISAMRGASRRSDAVTPVEVFSRKDIRNRGARSLADLLNNENGYNISTGMFGTNVQFQGLSSTYLLILKDGERINGRINNQIDLARFSLENVEKIEIVRGSSSSLYGADAIGGVINIITKPKGQTKLEANTSAGTLKDFEGNLSLQSKLGPIIYKVGGGYRTQAPYRRNASSIGTTGRGYNDANGLLSFVWNASKYWSTSLQGDYQQRRMYGVDVSSGGGVFDRTNLNETSQSIITLRHYVPKKSEFKVNGNISYFRDQFLYDQRNDTALDNYQDTREISSQVNAFYSTKFIKNHQLTLGSEVFGERLSTPRIGDNPRQRSRLAVYAQDDITIHKIVLSPSGRYDHDSQFGNFTSPRVALKWGLPNSLTLRASGGLGFRSPSFRELYLYFENPGVGYTVNGNPSLRPERSISYNLSAEMTPLNWFSVDISGYYNLLDDLIQTTSVPGSGTATRFQYKNINSVYTTGADTRVSFLVIRNWRLDLGYSFTQAWNKSANRYLEGRTKHRGNLGVHFTNNKFIFFIRSALNGPRPYYNGESTKKANFSKTYLSLDAKLEWIFAKGLSLYAGGENLANAGDARYNPLQPLRVYMGMRAQLDSRNYFKEKNLDY